MQALVDEPATDAVPAGLGRDQQDPQLRDGGYVAGDAEHAPDAPAVELGDPRGLATLVVADGEVGHDLGHQRLEAAVPPELLGVDLAVGHHDPAEVARLVGGADHHLEIIGNHGHGEPLRPD